MRASDDLTRSMTFEGCFTREAEDIPGFDRFYSADTRFPVSIAYPRGHVPSYDFNRARRLSADFPDCFMLICEDTGVNVRSSNWAQIVKHQFERGEQERRAVNRAAREEVISTARNLRLITRGDGMATVGRNGLPGQVPRLVWHDGEMVFFPDLRRDSRYDTSIWKIVRTSNLHAIGDDDFATALRSMQWLPDEWFSRLPARFQYGE